MFAVSLLSTNEYLSSTNEYYYGISYTCVEEVCWNDYASIMSDWGNFSRKNGKHYRVPATQMNLLHLFV